MTPYARGHLAMLTFSALVAGSFSLGALAANEIAPTALNAVRFAIAAALLGAVVVARRREIPVSATRAPWRYLVLGGLFSCYFVLMFEGLKTAPPVSSSAVFTTTPLLAAAFGWLLLRQEISPRMLTALAVGAVGALWVIFRADLDALLAFEIGRGEAIFFVGCMAHALYIPMVRRLNRGEDALLFTFGTISGGTLVLFAYGWPAIGSTDWGALPPIVFITIAYTAIFATAGSFTLAQYAAMRLPSAKVMAYTYLVPVWVILWELGLGQALPAPIIMSGVFPIILALFLLLRPEN